MLGAIGLVVLLLLGAMYLFGFGLFQRSTAGFRGKTGVIERTKGDPSFRIASYDHFFDQCASVKSDEGTIKFLEEELKTGPSEQRREQINATLSTLRASRNDKINQYNADAAKAGTQGQFRDSGLPFRLDPSSEETTCSP
jgi:hypothetical protein